MELSFRRCRILAAIVESYIESGEPVSSKFILQREGLDVSSATIRNDLAYLEKQGYLHQPHTSAGRVPTEMGYRFYVDHLLELPLLLREYECLWFYRSLLQY